NSGIGTWLGTNWVVDAGTLSSNAIYLHAISNFSWIIAGTDKVASLYFQYNPTMPNSNARMVPYTGLYKTASDIVNQIEGGTGPGSNTKIAIVALWSPLYQVYIPYGYNASIQ